MVKEYPPLRDLKTFEKNPQIQIYGHRLFKDQTLYEYLLEFLVVFISKKGDSQYSDADEGFSFYVPTNGEKLTYFPAPKIGLKRFVFFNHSDQEKRFAIDKSALNAHRKHLDSLIDLNGNKTMPKQLVLEVLQDLLYGFNAVTGKRSWFAQSLLPMAPEMIFCEAIGSKSVRTKLSELEGEQGDNENKWAEIDKKFKFDQHAFMARGGEVYYLHVAQALQNAAPECKYSITVGIKEMISGIEQLSQISRFIQNQWEEVVDNSKENDLYFHYIKKTAEFIPNTYAKRGDFTVEEIHNLISCELDPFEKIKLFGTLIAMQIIRLMTLQATETIKAEDSQEWLIDLTNDSKSPIRKIAVNSYRDLEENVFRAIHHADLESYLKKNENINMTATKAFDAAAKDTNLLVRRLAKSIGLVIPVKGPNMRFSLNEDLVKVLVVTLIEPGERLLFSTFLKKCYKHFKIIIGSKEAAQHFHEREMTHLVDFDENEAAFQQLLKNCGFLRNLSDATSIVENPFKG
ncbi:hypothetical protein BBH88_04525 [Planococcus antarcticus DSM 14505]|uniref:Uncharacterized protein n=1 Tax=Planococcus antarcticus DSM 14505 TaxID=1185653 RepID=A0ABM6D319_9BACL|nr:hypothetical protein [Planococcus antarcticus]ANU09612.1 hypothetical protein BBH88_04525 [Planococcus antarcticus DSM 14505]